MCDQCNPVLNGLDHISLVPAAEDESTFTVSRDQDQSNWTGEVGSKVQLA
jgi:hypothetical protein